MPLRILWTFLPPLSNALLARVLATDLRLSFFVKVTVGHRDRVIGIYVSMVEIVGPIHPGLAGDIYFHEALGVWRERPRHPPGKFGYHNFYGYRTTTGRKNHGSVLGSSCGISGLKRGGYYVSMRFRRWF